MAKNKKIRKKGKIQLKRYFKNFEEGERVAVVSERTVKSAFPRRIIGKTGVVSGSRGKFKEIKIQEGGKIKTFIIHPIHLNKIK